MPVKIIKRKKPQADAKPRDSIASAVTQADVAKDCGPTLARGLDMTVDESTGEILNYEPPKFDPTMDPAKVIREYDRLITHFNTMPTKYPNHKPHDAALWERCKKPIERDRAAYIAFAKEHNLKLPKGVK